ncbi:hypothetical protein [Symbioplanes lichenis]|uniref:hypothetical protein n=1 Tax=Symbioplanes lichenis TaxID=1629072 RepID=UPI0027387D2B|nr:hypothetical protein [Actinoplanes lichenis]
MTLLDRVVHWNLDLDGDLYGDERERFRWYEGMTTSASLQSFLLPWAAAVMVWPLGEPSVLPLAVMLGVSWFTQLLATVYVRRRRVDTTPRSWSSRRIALIVITILPLLIFIAGARYVRESDNAAWLGVAVGGLAGALIAVVVLIIKGRLRDREEARAGEEI